MDVCLFAYVNAFAGCTALESVIIPESVTSIGNMAFVECIILSIYYNGTEADWANVSKGTDAIPEGATVYFYSESKPEGEGNYWHYDTNGVPTTEWDD